MACALRDRGHEVEVLTGFPNYPGGKVYSGYRIGLYQQEVMEGIRVTRVPLYPSHDRSAIRRIVNYLSFGFAACVLGPWFVNKPDVIYVYNLITLGPLGRFSDSSMARKSSSMSKIFGLSRSQPRNDEVQSSIEASSMVVPKRVQKCKQARCPFSRIQAKPNRSSN